MKLVIAMSVQCCCPGIIACSTSSELSRSSSPDIVINASKRVPISQQNIGTDNENQDKIVTDKDSVERRLDIRASNEFLEASTFRSNKPGSSSSTVTNLSIERPKPSEMSQLQTPPTSSPARSEVRVVIPIKYSKVSEPRIYRRIILPTSSPPNESEPESENEDDLLLSQSYITLRTSEEINKLAREYRSLPASEQKKYRKTDEVRRAIWPKENRPSDSLLQLALYSMRPQERHCKYPFAFNSQGNTYAEYDHLREREDSIIVIPSVETKRSDRSRPSSQIKSEHTSERLPARYSPDLWVQDQSSFNQGINLRAENEKYRRENETLSAEIEKLREERLEMTGRLQELEGPRSDSIANSAILACQRQAVSQESVIPGSGITPTREATFIVRIYQVPSSPATQIASQT